MCMTLLQQELVKQHAIRRTQMAEEAIRTQQEKDKQNQKTEDEAEVA